jgi:hypothetical protein
MTDSEDALDRAYEALISQDWAKLRLLLHPYLHFTGPDGVKTRGRTKVLAVLSSQAVPERPTSVELRDGQIYRWQN